MVDLPTPNKLLFQLGQKHAQRFLRLPRILACFSNAMNQTQTASVRLKPGEDEPAGESDVYQLQNQDGFNQWRQQNEPMPAPAAFNPFPYRPAPAYGGVYRKGFDLVVHERVGLPPYCIKCDEEVSGSSGGAFLRQKFRWHHPAVYVAIISPMIYVILALALSKRATLDLPLCGTHMAKRRKMRNSLIGIGVFSLFAIIALTAANSIGWAFMVFLVTIIGIPLWCEYIYKPLRVDKMENDYVYLRGVHHKYLERLPPC